MQPLSSRLRGRGVCNTIEDCMNSERILYSLAHTQKEKYDRNRKYVNHYCMDKYCIFLGVEPPYILESLTLNYREKVKNKM
jgi:hypothetical protein